MTPSLQRFHGSFRLALALAALHVLVSEAKAEDKPKKVPWPGLYTADAQPFNVAVGLGFTAVNEYTTCPRSEWTEEEQRAAAAVRETGRSKLTAFGCDELGWMDGVWPREGEDFVPRVHEHDTPPATTFAGGSRSRLWVEAGDRICRERRLVLTFDGERVLLGEDADPRNCFVRRRVPPSSWPVHFQRCDAELFERTPPRTRTVPEGKTPGEIKARDVSCADLVLSWMAAGWFDAEGNGHDFVAKLRNRSNAPPTLYPVSVGDVICKERLPVVAVEYTFVLLKAAPGAKNCFMAGTYYSRLEPKE